MRFFFAAVPVSPRGRLSRRIAQAGATAALVVAALVVTAAPALATVTVSQPTVPTLARGTSGEVTFILGSASDQVSKITFTAPGNTTFSRDSYTYNGGPGAIPCGLSGDAKALTCPETGTRPGYYWPDGSTIGVRLLMDPAAPAGTAMTSGSVVNYDWNGVQNGQGTYTVQTPATADIVTTVTAQPHLGILVPYLTYTLTAHNDGPNNADYATLTASLPAGVTATNPSSGCAASTGTVVCAFGPVSSGTSANKSFRVPLHLLSLGQVTVTGVRTLSAPTDTDPANDTDSATCNVLSVILVTCT
ncbi:hypothetical protein AB0M43_35860 [Longispora sp. NPDC051575]|uniref:hypothetical protein n=1 Tax=Longispora sp. NPDC051575 TaxID=3154943 RepID=UPI0034189C10